MYYIIIEKRSLFWSESIKPITKNRVSPPKTVSSPHTQEPTLALKTFFNKKLLKKRFILLDLNKNLNLKFL